MTGIVLSFVCVICGRERTCDHGAPLRLGGSWRCTDDLGACMTTLTERIPADCLPPEDDDAAV